MRAVISIAAVGSIIASVAAIGLFAYYHLAGPVLYCSCAYELNVEIISEKGGIEQVYCEPLPFLEIAQEVVDTKLKNFALDESMNFGVLETYVPGKPVTVGVRFDVTVYPLGKERASYGYRKLAVVAQYKDGSRFGTVADIPRPKRRMAEEWVTVKLP